MLPLTHIYPITRKNKVSPMVYRIEQNSIQAVGDLLKAAQEMIGSRKREILESLRYFHGEIPPNILQALLKLIFKHSEFGFELIEDPMALRAAVFDSSFEYRKSQTEILTPEIHRQRILDNLDLPEILRTASVGDWLYCDVESNHILKKIEDITPEALINEFNISQVQGLLMQGKQVHVSINKLSRQDLRMFMKYLKFFGLLFDIKSQTQDLLELEISGPASVLQNSRSYGFDIAKLFPVLLNLSNQWTLHTEIFLKNKGRVFNLSLNEKNPYLPIYRTTGVWRNQKIVEIVDYWNKKHAEKGKAVHIDELISLSRNLYLLPDIKISEKKNRKSFLFEWYRYTNDALWEKLFRIRNELPENYYFLIKGDKTKIPEKLKPLLSNIIFHRQEPLTGSLLKKIKEKSPD